MSSSSSLSVPLSTSDVSQVSQPSEPVEQLGFTQLIAGEPIVTPPIPEISWDKKWISMLTLVSDSVNNIRLYAKLVPCRDNLEIGDKELKTPLVDTDVTVITIDNVWSVLPTNPKFAMAMELIFQCINDYGVEQGILKASASTVVTDVDSSSESSLDPSSESSQTTQSPVV